MVVSFMVMFLPWDPNPDPGPNHQQNKSKDWIHTSPPDKHI